MKRSLFGAMALSVAVYASVAHAVDRDFTTHNDVGATITQLYVSPSNVVQWGPDQLGSHVLPNGAAVTLHFNPSNYPRQCVFDIKIVEEDGDQSVLHGINLCTITDVTFSRNAAGSVVASSH